MQISLVHKHEKIKANEPTYRDSDQNQIDCLVSKLIITVINYREML